MKIDSQHVPNLPVHVVLMRGRVPATAPKPGQPAGRDDARYRPATLAASLDLEVEPVRNQVLASVSPSRDGAARLEGGLHHHPHR